jgi:hypothetical protein
MIARTQTGRLKMLSGLRNGAIALAAAFLLTAGVLGFEVVLRNREAGDLEHQTAFLDQQISVTKGEVQRANRLTSSPVVVNDLGAVGRLQSDISRIAAANKCTVPEFQSSAELSPYLTRFAKTTSISGWGQVEVDVSISGSARNVAATLARLVDADVPFEFDALELTRDHTNEVGDATIIGHATLRVLIRTAKESA